MPYLMYCISLRLHADLSHTYSTLQGGDTGAASQAACGRWRANSSTFTKFVTIPLTLQAKKGASKILSLIVNRSEKSSVTGYATVAMTTVQDQQGLDPVAGLTNFQAASPDTLTLRPNAHVLSTANDIYSDWYLGDPQQM